MSRRRQRSFRTEAQSLNIPAKANRVLNVILGALVLIILRIWHLSVIQYDSKVEEARRPQRRVIVEPAKRGTIRDRYNIPLAINKVQYNAAILYSQLRQIPSFLWKKGENGKRYKVFKRREYISQLSQLLADELNLDPERVEDLIYSKGSFYLQIPFVIKEDITEQEYYRLKMLEKDWIGIHVQRLPKRYYPQGKTGSDIIGYMGAINRQEYDAIIQEMASLDAYLQETENGEESSLPEGFKSSEQVRIRLKDLEERAYTINDYVGKAGIEGRFERDLRGFHGKKSYYSDARGNFLRELPGTREPLSGQRLLLTISSELQEYAERLLIQNEKVREAKVSVTDPAQQIKQSHKQPWIKGGAIVAMDPQTGEVLALASHPRFDPNDFIISGNPEINKKKHSQIKRWFESEGYIAEIWNGKRMLERELYDNVNGEYYEDQLPLTWGNYLKIILPQENPAAAWLANSAKVEQTIEMQKTVNQLLEMSKQDDVYALFNVLYQGDEHTAFNHRQVAGTKERLESLLKEQDPVAASLKKKLDRYFAKIPQNYDKILALDLVRVAVRHDFFDDELLRKAGQQSLSAYRENTLAFIAVREVVHEMAKELYHELSFREWRKENEKAYLKQKRIEEKAANRAAKPYLDYFDQLEKEFFVKFWDQHGWGFLLAFLTGKAPNSIPEELALYYNHFFTWHGELVKGAHYEMEWHTAYHILNQTIHRLSLSQDLTIKYLKTFRSYHQLDRPLYGKYRHLRTTEGKQFEKNLAAAFYPVHGYGYGRSQAYRQSATQGSIFKLVTAYEALVQHLSKLPKGESSSLAQLNPLEIVDTFFRHGKQSYVGYTQDGKLIPRIYKGGRLPRSLSRSLGKLDLLKAIETSSNPYFSLLAGDIMESPEDLGKCARQFGYGSFTGIELSAEIPGKIPNDLSSNRTGLYATAIGQHTLVVTPLQTSVMLSAIANGGKVLKPKILLLKAGHKPQRGLDRIPSQPNFPYRDALSLVGIDFPLFTAALNNEEASLISSIPTEIKREVFMPAAIRKILLEGMHRVVIKTQGESLNALSKIYHEHPEAISDYIDLKDELLGKTSTSEAIENIDMDLTMGTNLYNHVWFGGIAFNKGECTKDKETFVFKDKYGTPELVVVVYLRFGGYGKEAAPIAAQIVKKWREIKNRN